MHDPHTLIYGNNVFQLWHHDPERDGSDDSCGWFKRARHGNPDTLKRIVNSFESDWDRQWTYDPEANGDDDVNELKRGPVTYERGYFKSDKTPRFSTQGVVLNLMFWTAFEHFNRDREKTQKFMRRKLFDILLFAENPTDSLHDALWMTFGDSGTRKERIQHFAEICYGWVLRESQPWWRHPRWHVFHWKLTFRG